MDFITYLFFISHTCSATSSYVMIMKFSVVFHVQFPGETVLTGRDLNQVRNGCHSFEVRAHGGICLDWLILVLSTHLKKYLD